MLTLRKLIRPALKILMNSYGLRKSFPRAVVFGGPKYFGVDVFCPVLVVLTFDALLSDA